MVLGAPAIFTPDIRSSLVIPLTFAQLCVIGGADKLVAESLEPIADLIKQFVQNDGKIWLCPVCAKVKGITNDDLAVGPVVLSESER
jgi:predicted peroxiredoxin